MRLYLDSSALVKHYVDEPGSQLLRRLMADASEWFACRVGFVETVRAVTLAAGERAARPVREEWPAFAVVEVDQELVEAAAGLALKHGLGSLDGLHLAATLLLPEETVFVSWDERLVAAARLEGRQVAPS